VVSPPEAAAAGTVRLEKERLRALERLLAQIAPIDLKLKDIDIKLIRNYQPRRIAEGVGPRTVIMEGQLLRSILKHHEQWKLGGKYEPLPEPVSEVGRSLTPEEEVRLMDTAKSRPEWAVAYHATILENETGMRGVEVRNLQMKRIDLRAREIRLQKSKTKGEVRTVPLNVDALASAKELLARAEKLGASQPDHYRIPTFVKSVIEGRSGGAVSIRRYDPARPTKGWRTAWRKLTAKAGLRRLRGHDLRGLRISISRPARAIRALASGATIMASPWAVRCGFPRCTTAATRRFSFSASSGFRSLSKLTICSKPFPPRRIVTAISPLRYPGARR